MNVGIQDIIVALIMTGCLLYAGRNLLQFFRKGDKPRSGCGCGCSGCPKAAGAKKFVPLKVNESHG